MALSLFVSINNNFKIRVLAQALTKYETQADYIWILHCTLKATNNLSSIVLYTDSDPAMLTAVQVVYPQTRHLLCIYHITENVKKRPDPCYVVRWLRILLKIFITCVIVIVSINLK